MWEYEAIDPSGNELQHWKYIRKYRTSSGKWRYVYADDNTHIRINKVLSNARQLVRTQNRLRNAVTYDDRGNDVLTSTAAIRRSDNQKRLAEANKSLSQISDFVDVLINTNTPASKIKQSASNLYNKGKSFVEKLGNITLTTTEYSKNGETVGTSEFKVKDLFKKK